MASPTASSRSSTIRNRFRGAVLGALLGDCLGAYWEMQSWRGVHSLDKVKAKIASQVLETTQTKKAPLISYTDDTALTLALGDSLVECGKFNPAHCAQIMTEVYYDNPRRGYGKSVSAVFYGLKNSQYSDVFGPACQQFKGEGSCGNGSAMRISPAALLGFKEDKVLVEICSGSSKVTHSHPSAINYAMLQAAAIKLAIQTDPNTLDPIKFTDNLSEFIRPYEPSEALDRKTAVEAPTASGMEIDYISGQPTCLSRLRQIREFLLCEEPPAPFLVQQILGHGVLAAEAVPCAIYAFLCHTGKSFQELIPFAISLGGDTDTIASMAGAIGGGYWGFDAIPQEWLDSCEEVSRCHDLADSLYDMVFDDGT